MESCYYSVLRWLRASWDYICRRDAVALVPNFLRSATLVALNKKKARPEP